VVVDPGWASMPRLRSSARGGLCRRDVRWAGSAGWPGDSFVRHSREPSAPRELPRQRSARRSPSSDTGGRAWLARRAGASRRGASISGRCAGARACRAAHGTQSTRGDAVCNEAAMRHAPCGARWQSQRAASRRAAHRSVRRFLRGRCSTRSSCLLPRATPTAPQLAAFLPSSSAGPAAGEPPASGWPRCVVPGLNARPPAGGGVGGGCAGGGGGAGGAGRPSGRDVVPGAVATRVQVRASCCGWFCACRAPARPPTAFESVRASTRRHIAAQLGPLALLRISPPTPSLPRRRRSRSPF
jgi:hypothetical protein